MTFLYKLSTLLLFFNHQSCKIQTVLERGAIYIYDKIINFKVDYFQDFKVYCINYEYLDQHY